MVAPRRSSAGVWMVAIIALLLAPHLGRATAPTAPAPHHGSSPSLSFRLS
jgi:hypothetical protein